MAPLCILSLPVPVSEIRGFFSMWRLPSEIIRISANNRHNQLNFGAVPTCLRPNNWEGYEGPGPGNVLRPVVWIKCRVRTRISADSNGRPAIRGRWAVALGFRRRPGQRSGKMDGQVTTSNSTNNVRVRIAGVEPSGDARWSSFWSSFWSPTLLGTD